MHSFKVKLTGEKFENDEKCVDVSIYVNFKNFPHYTNSSNQSNFPLFDF